ncbi:MAG: adenylate/guanylate cyclase domain-containing protein [Pseudomonadota bacterium]|nr:MAG: adenylate/guanylate cyclase domain-containing protein [Pseudomonadota bacterium]
MISNHPRRSFWSSAGGAGVLTVLVVALLYLWDPTLLEVVELKSYDLRQSALTARAPSGAVTIVAIDEKSLGEIGRWPWPRATLARLVEQLDQAGARVIAFDIFFPEAEHTGDRGAGADLALAQAMSKSGKVVLSTSFLMSMDDVRHVSPAAADRAFDVVRDSALDGPDVANLPRPVGMLANVPLLQRAARYSGHINVFPDRDGTLRAIPLVIGYRSQYFPAADLQATRLYRGDLPLTVHAEQSGIIGLGFGGRHIDTDAIGRSLIHYYGPERTFLHLPAVDVLTRNFPRESVADKIVLIGPTAKGIGDIRVTPYGAAFPGVEIRATVLENILGNTFIRRPTWLPIVELSLLIALGLALARLLPRLSLQASAIVCIGLSGTYVAVALWLFSAHFLWVTLTYPLVLFLLLFMTSNIVQYLLTEAQRRHIKTAFQYYVPAAVVEEIARDVESLRLGGERRELTVLFSDIRGFTGISEQLAPEDLVRLLNVYLTEMTEQVFRHHGSLDKYIGDAIMAVYGAPIAHADHARLACRTALAMLARLQTLHAGWQRDNVPGFDVGIGINTGPMIVGNMGSEKRFNYTVIGDAVNLGSRIEALNKTYGSRILLSETTYALVRDEFPAIREIDRVRVRGRETPVRIYELIPDGAYPNLDWLEDFARAYALRRAGQLADAAEAFTRLYASVGDPVSAYHARRCRLPRRRKEDQD